MVVEFFAFALHVAWIACALMAFASWRHMHDIGDAPLVPIAQAQPGMQGSFHGRAAFFGAEQRSPIADAPAVWFDWKVEQTKSPSGYSLDVNELLAEGNSKEPFAIDDEMGNRILVWPENAELDGTDGQSWRGEIPRSAHGSLRDQLPGSVGELSRLGGLDLAERRLRPGVACVVVGRLEPPRPEYGSRVRGFMTGSLGQPIHIATGTTAEVQESMRRRAVIWTTGAGLLFVGALAVTLDRLGFG